MIYDAARDAWNNRRDAANLRRQAQQSRAITRDSRTSRELLEAADALDREATQIETKIRQG